MGKVVNVVDIADIDIARELIHILERINEAIPTTKMRSFTSTADIGEYAANSATLRVREVMSGDEVDDAEPLDLGSHIINQPLNNAEGYNFPSLLSIEAMRRVRGMQKIRFSYHPIGKKIKIDPTPSVTGKIYWYTSVESNEWTLTALPTEFQELVIAGVTWKCLMIAFLRRSSEGGILREGGRVEYPASTLQVFADSYKEQFLSALDTKRRLYEE